MAIKVLDEFLPPAKDVTLGAVKVGESLKITPAGTLNVSSNINIMARTTNCISEIPQTTIISTNENKIIVYEGTVYSFANEEPNILPTNKEITTTTDGTYYVCVNENTELVLAQEYSNTYSLPLAKITLQEDQLTIDKVYNGFGFIGNTIFVLAGVKGLIPNGRDTNSELNNTEFIYTTSKIAIPETDGTYLLGCNGIDLLLLNRNTKYDLDTNYNILNDTPLAYTLCGTVTVEDGNITNFITRSTFYAADYYDLITAYPSINTLGALAWKDKVETTDIASSGIAQSAVTDLVTTLEGKQDALTFDDTPTQNSDNPVKSGGIYSVLANKQDALTAGTGIDITNGVISEDSIAYVTYGTTTYAEVTEALINKKIILCKYNDNLYQYTTTVEGAYYFTCLATSTTTKHIMVDTYNIWSNGNLFIQSRISDLDTIRAGANAGATALQPNPSITGATKCKITYDSNGLITAGADLIASDIPAITLDKISDITASASEVNVLTGITASTAELNVLDGLIASTTELNYVDGVTSPIQTQINNKVEKNTSITGDTKCKITYDSKGLVTAGTDLNSSDITTALGYTPYNSTNPNGYQANILEGVQVNNTDLTITNKKVNITVPTKISDLTDDTLTYPIDQAKTLAGLTASLTELNYVEGVNAPIQTQIGTLNNLSTDTKTDLVAAINEVDLHADTNADNISTINSLIPNSATTSNQLADKNFVNSSIATNTANFIGTFQSVEELEEYAGTLTNNDYAFVEVTDEYGNNAYDRYKYTTATDPASWQFEYELNNSNFTANQWAAINSGATSTNISQITTNQTNIGTLSSLTTTAKTNLVSAINELDSNKVNGNNAITGATKCKITYDSKGLVTAGTDLTDTDIPNLTLAKISDITATAAELNVLDGITATTAELNILDGVTATASELNILDGATLTTEELNYVNGVTSSIQTQIDNKVTKNTAITGATKCKITYDNKGLVTAGTDLEATDIPNLSISKITDITATAAELNVLDGITATTTELNYVDGVTSAIQTQLDNKVSKVSSASKIYGTDSSGAQTTYDYSSFGAVDDVKVGNTSVVTNKIATLGTMAGETATDYTKTANLATVATSGSYTDLLNQPTIPVVNDATLTIQKNSTTLDTFTANAATNKTINITVPTTYSDVGALPDSTKYGAGLSLSINSSTYIITAQLKDQDGNNLGSAQTIDLPLESVVVNGSYDDETKKIILTLQNGSTIEFSVADLVSGLQSEITSENKLDADLVDDSTSTNKFVTTSNINTWNGKQDAISDLDTIRSGASAGATALQPNTAITGATKCKITYDSKGLVTAGADLSSSDITTALGYTPYNSTNPSGYQANVLEGVQVNGTDLTITSKKVNVPVPTTVAELTDASNYALVSSLATVATSGSYTDYQTSRLFQQ